MKFSLVASFDGWLDDSFCPCDTTLMDAANACIKTDVDRIAEGLEPAFRFDKNDVSEPGDSKYTYLSEDADDEWSKLQGFQVAAVLDRDELDLWLQSLGAWANTNETMGTLGGPLAPWGGVVWDCDFTIESARLISSIRVTPVPWNARTNEPLEGALALCFGTSERSRGQAFDVTNAERLAERYQGALKAAVLGEWGL